MKYIYILALTAILFSFAENDAYALRKRGKGQNSCTIFRGKYNAADLVEINYGATIGENIITVKSKDGTSQDVITGMLGGLAVQIVWPKGFGIQPEILYSRKGTIFQNVGLRYKIDYLEVPVSFMYRLHMADVKPFIKVAPYGAYALNIKVDGDLVADDKYTNQINKWDYGIGLGAGFDVWKLQLSFKYNWGFPKVIDNANNIRSRDFVLSVSVLF